MANVKLPLMLFKDEKDGITVQEVTMGHVLGVVGFRSALASYESAHQLVVIMVDTADAGRICNAVSENTFLSLLHNICF